MSKISYEDYIMALTTCRRYIEQEERRIERMENKGLISPDTQLGDTLISPRTYNAISYIIHINRGYPISKNIARMPLKRVVNLISEQDLREQKGVGLAVMKELKILFVRAGLELMETP